jgi:hypothetical protein
VLAPTDGPLRLVPFDDRAAWRLYAALMGLATLAVIGTLGARLLALLDVPEPYVVVFLTLVRIFFAAVLLFVIWTMRREVSAAIDLEDDHQGFWGAVRDLGPYLATAYVLSILLFGIIEIVQAGELTPGAVLGSLLLVVVAPLLDMALCRILTPRSSASGDAARPGTPSTGPYGPVMRRIVHILVAVGSLETLAWLWELDIAALTERSLGGRVARAVVDIAVTALAAYLAWTVVREGGTLATRLRTLLPLDVRPDRDRGHGRDDRPCGAGREHRSAAGGGWHRRDRDRLRHADARA